MIWRRPILALTVAAGPGLHRVLHPLSHGLAAQAPARHRLNWLRVKFGLWTPGKLFSTGSEATAHCCQKPGVRHAAVRSPGKSGLKFDLAFTIRLKWYARSDGVHALGGSPQRSVQRLPIVRRPNVANLYFRKWKGLSHPDFALNLPAYLNSITSHKTGTKKSTVTQYRCKQHQDTHLPQIVTCKSAAAVNSAPRFGSQLDRTTTLERNILRRQ